MIINLNEIPSEGRSYVCDNHTGELTEILRDIIADTPYRAEFFVRPAHNLGTFELAGSIGTSLPEQCSRCGLDYKLQIQETFRELLLPESATPRTGKFQKVNHYSDLANEGPSVAEYQGHHFNIGEYLHEVVALAAPFVPAPAEDEQGNCSLCKISLKNHVFNYSEEMEIKNRPFEALKKLKLN